MLGFLWGTATAISGMKSFLRNEGHRKECINKGMEVYIDNQGYERFCSNGKRCYTGTNKNGDTVLKDKRGRVVRNYSKENREKLENNLIKNAIDCGDDYTYWRRKEVGNSHIEILLDIDTRKEFIFYEINTPLVKKAIGEENVKKIGSCFCMTVKVQYGTKNIFDLNRHTKDKIINAGFSKEDIDLFFNRMVNYINVERIDIDNDIHIKKQ